MYQWKPTAINQIYLDENTGGKGRYFRCRFLQPGLVKYSFGVCLLDKETIDKFINKFIGCPVIIGHNDVTDKNAKELSCGNICHIWYDQIDGWYWGDGIIDSQEALDLIEDGYNVSCQYEITEFANNTTNALHNGNPYDKVILNGKPEHLAIVKTPRYENAMIAVNALDLTAENARGFGGEEGEWITVNGTHIFIPDGKSKEEVIKEKFGNKEEKKDISKDYKDSVKFSGMPKEDKQGLSNIKESRDEHGRLVLSKEGTNKKVKIHKNGEYYLASYGQELKDDDGYTEFQLFPSASGKSFKTEAGARKWANKMLAENTLTDTIKQAINEIKDTNMFKKLFKKKERKMETEELKALFMDCIQECLKAKNEEDKEDKDVDLEEEGKDAANCGNKKVKNEDVDKRDIIRQIMAIAGKEEATEDVKTIAKLAEKLAYDKSEAGTADNCGKKGKNEDKEEDEDKKDDKEKASNSIDEQAALFSNIGTQKSASLYISKEDRIELGNELF